METHDRHAHLIGAWFRVIFGVTLAVVLATLISNYTQRDNLIASCIRNGDSKIIDARFMESAEKARAEAGDPGVAEEYRVDAIDKRATIPMPDGWVGSPEIRGDSRKDRTEGCKDAFPAPIPWIE